MFTGIIEDKGKIARVEPKGQGKRLTIVCPAGLTELNPGDSISVNGACLTVVDKEAQTIVVDLSGETLEKTTLGKVREGEAVHLERALRLSDRLGGHLVTGHVDDIGVITEARKEGEFLRLRIRIPRRVSRYVIEKGSIAIDGVSLTVNESREEEIGLMLVPYTLEKTTLLDKRVGDRVNVEADLLGKYVEKLLDRRSGKAGEITRAFLEGHGFLKGE